MPTRKQKFVPRGITLFDDHGNLLPGIDLTQIDVMAELMASSSSLADVDRNWALIDGAHGGQRPAGLYQQLDELGVFYGLIDNATFLADVVQDLRPVTNPPSADDAALFAVIDQASSARLFEQLDPALFSKLSGRRALLAHLQSRKGE